MAVPKKPLKPVEKQAVPKQATVVRTVDLELIELNKTLQCRKLIDKKIVDEYAGLISDKVEIPPLRVVSVSGSMLLVDGFTRHAAYIMAGKTKCRVEVSKGTFNDAVLEACAANKTHGLRRSAEDTQRAVALAKKTFPDMKPDDVAVLVGISRATAYRYSTTPKQEKTPKAKPEPKDPPKDKPASVPKKQAEAKKPDAKKPEAKQVEPEVAAEVEKFDPCSICGGTDFELTDGGHQCIKCLQAKDDKPIAEAVKSGKAVQSTLAFKKVHTALGQLVREIEKAGIMHHLKEALEAVSAKLGEI